MKRISLLCFTWVFFLTAGAQSKQSPDFVVYFSSGKASLLAGNKTTPLKKGIKVFSNDKIQLGTGAKVTLVCGNYHTVELTTAGNFPAATINKLCSVKKTSLTSAYFKYIWEEFTHPHSSPEKKPEKYMQTAGAVTRGKDPVALALGADSVRIFNSDFKISYTPASDTLRLVVFNKALSLSRPVYSAQINKAVPIGEVVKKLSDAGTYQWQLIDKRNRRGPFHTIIKSTEKEHEAAIAAIVDATNNNPNAAERAFMTAFMLERQHFLSEAENFYRKAVTLDPKNTSYQAFLKRFL